MADYWADYPVYSLAVPLLTLCWLVSPSQRRRSVEVVIMAGLSTVFLLQALWYIAIQVEIWIHTRHGLPYLNDGYLWARYHTLYEFILGVLASLPLLFYVIPRFKRLYEAE